MLIRFEIFFSYKTLKVVLCRFLFNIFPEEPRINTNNVRTMHLFTNKLKLADNSGMEKTSNAS